MQAMILNHKKMIVSKQPLEIRGFIEKKDSYLISCLYEEEQMSEVYCTTLTNQSILGNIYIGKVQNIIKNLNAAFIDFGNGQKGFYSLEDLKDPIFVKKIGNKPLCIGDELLVQVSKEALKTKDPVLSTNLTLSGKYIVLTSENKSLGISTKLNKVQRENLKLLVKDKVRDSYGIIVRTSAKSATEEMILKELNELEEIFDTLLLYAKNRPVFTCLYEADKDELRFLKDTNLSTIDEIITDDKAIYEMFSSYLKDIQDKSSLQKLRFYEDKNYSLIKLYQIEKFLERALKKHVWLKSGAYLVIEQTEALTVIDVNSGKNVSKKNASENQYLINLEAAKEIAKQLCIRNISGICIIDFISMDEKSYDQKLMDEFNLLLKQDKVPTQLIDITKLGLVEVTRKKVKKSLKEQIYDGKTIDVAEET